MFDCKPDELGEDVVSLLTTRMAIGHWAGHHVERDPAETARHPDTDVAGIELLEAPSAANVPKCSFHLIRLSAIARIARRR